MKFIFYTILFIIIYLVLKGIFRANVNLKKPPPVKKTNNPSAKKTTKIDKDKIVDAEYEEL